MKPDWVLVQGDTTTVMAAALLSYYHRIKVGHVEAGLRTGDKWQPFPEEVNRQVASVVTDLHFAPTEWSRQNLLKENVRPRPYRCDRQYSDRCACISLRTSLQTGKYWT
jgi:UDP-N-acetylglucosamine 2-epimerase (non-hydrolysing)